MDKNEVTVTKKENMYFVGLIFEHQPIAIPMRQSWEFIGIKNRLKEFRIKPDNGTCFIKIIADRIDSDGAIVGKTYGLDEFTKEKLYFTVEEFKKLKFELSVSGIDEFCKKVPMKQIELLSSTVNDLVKDINGMLSNPGSVVYADKIGKSARMVMEASMPIIDKGYQVNLIDSVDLYDYGIDTNANIQIDDVNYTLPSIISYIAEKQAK